MKKLLCLSLLGLLLSSCSSFDPLDRTDENQELNALPTPQAHPTDTPDQVQDQKADQLNDDLEDQQTVIDMGH